ncbi:MAG TPA: hypothetical protein ENN19_16885 [Chloroflexi bacterium]|nr:hypothetical protein [Chloroflexota bacterium]
MKDLAYTLTVRRLVAIWSDRSQKEAAKFVDGRRDLLPRRITSAQLYGLADVVRSAHRFTDIQKFTRHQGEKAERAGRLDVRDYWVEMEKALRDLRKDAENLCQQAGPPPPKVSEKPALDELHCKLVNEFVKHLVAHSLYWSPLPKKEK